jgi:hypothetical protein
MALKREVEDAVIPNAGTDSATVTVPLNKTLLGFRIPGTFTGTSVSFKMGIEATDTQRPIYNGATLVSISVAVNRFYYVDPKIFVGCAFLTIVSDAAEGGERTIPLVFGEV